MDRAQLSAAVYKKTGVALGSDDPAFALVELNRLGLREATEESAGKIAERLEPFPDRIRSSGAAVAGQVASQSALRVAEILTEARRTIAADTEQAQRRVAEHAAKLNERLSREVAAAVRAAEMISRAGGLLARWLLTAAVIGVLLFALGFVSGMAVGPQALLRVFGGG